MMTDTITAIATPPGVGGIAVIRISGPDALSALQSIIRTDTNIDTLQNHHVYHAWIMDKDEPVDEVLFTWFQRPHSYTGEDVVEISGHGGPYLNRRILDLILKQGVRLADPGEFTQRAFLNGKMDLSQAEAVADLIHARTEASRRVAAYQLEGRLSERINVMRDALIEGCSLLELELDFSEEDMVFASREDLRSRFNQIQLALTELLTSFQRGRICREGLRLVIAGRPNVGKSSLLNRLIEKERAIVTDIPGTTRDTIEEMLDIEGLLFIITDTAGLRESPDLIEQEGVKRTRAAMNAADMILWTLDASQPWHPDDNAMLKYLKEKESLCICVINKSDLDSNWDASHIRTLFPEMAILRTSALTGKGIRDLIDTLQSTALSGDIPSEGETLITRIRHADAIQKTLDHLAHAKQALEENLSQEFIALDIRGALEALGRITGQTTTDDILNQIFTEFCIGK